MSLFRVHENTIIIGDLSEIHRRPTCLIGDLSEESDMSDRRPRHASLETHLKPTCPIGDRYAVSTTNRKQTCLV